MVERVELLELSVPVVFVEGSIETYQSEETLLVVMMGLVTVQGQSVMVMVVGWRVSC